jgi:rubrerythrin
MIEIEKCLLLLYMNQSHLRSLYEQFSAIADKEGFPMIATFFNNSANLKKEHAKWSYMMFQKILQKDLTESYIVTFDDIPPINSTYENLNNAFRIEEKVFHKRIPHCIEAANKQECDEISMRLEIIQRRIREAYQSLKIIIEGFDNISLLQKEDLFFWECQGCGFKISQESLPEDFVCPSCGQLRLYFQKKYLMFTPKEKIVWQCMECGNEVVMERLPNNWTCISCGKPTSYFKRKSSVSSDLQTSSYGMKRKGKAYWRCPSCGNKEETDLPLDWKCPKCGYKNE